MMVHSPRLWWLSSVLMLWIQNALCGETTIDTRDAVLALARSLHSTENKLERHEYREKELGEKLKKMIAGLEKKLRAFEQLPGMIQRQDERLSHVETILIEKEEREKKMHEELEGIKNSLQTLTSSVTQALKAKSTEIDNNLTTSDDTMDRKLDATDAKINDIKMQIEDIQKILNEDTVRATCLDLASESMNPLKMHILSAEKLLSKYELKLNEYNSTITKAKSDAASLDEVSLNDEAWHSNMTEVLIQQQKSIAKIEQAVLSAESAWKQLPRRADLRLATDEALLAIDNATRRINDYHDKSTEKIITKIGEMQDRLEKTNEDIQKSLTLGNNMSEQAFGVISTNYDKLHTEIKSLTNSEHVLLQTADNVITTKNRVDQGVEQILKEMRLLLKLHSTNINTTVHERFDGIGTAIQRSQEASITNMTGTIQSEMAQGWRLMGTMYQQLNANKQAIDTLMKSTQQFIRSNTKSMKDVKANVDVIMTKIEALGANMNFALGQLAMATQEFGLMSVGLTEALNDIKKIGSSEKSKPTDSKPDGPGPHPIPDKWKTP